MVWGTSSLLGWLMLCFISLLSVSATPITELPSTGNVVRDAVAKGTPLRIHSIGASIVWGMGSKFGDGFRWGFRSALVAEGSQVNMIGSKKCGQMGDDECDGWPGDRIQQVWNRTGVESSLKQKPNVVLVLAGTNDALQGRDPDDMADDMYYFIEWILTITPDAVVIVSTLPPNGNAKAEGIIEKYNQALPYVVNKLVDEEKKVYLVDNHSSWWSMADMQSDGIHPNDAGYLKMARVFYEGVHAIGPWITAPVKIDGLPFMGPSDPKSMGTPPALPKQP